MIEINYEDFDKINNLKTICHAAIQRELKEKEPKFPILIKDEEFGSFEIFEDYLGEYYVNVIYKPKQVKYIKLNTIITNTEEGFSL